MYNVVIDSNILVSGLLTSNGNPAQIINALKAKRFIMFYNTEIMIEYSDVLNRERFGFNKDDVNELLDVIIEIGTPVLIKKSTIPLADEDDRVFYDVAISSNSYLITGNIDDYPKESFIIKPKEFIDMLNRMFSPD